MSSGSPNSAFYWGIFMKNSLRLFIALASLGPVAAMADVTLYGKANVSFEFVDEGDDSYTALESNSSRIGFKGSEKINDAIEAIYQLEYEAHFDDGSTTFGHRNLFIGIKGDFGQVIAGRFDTPLKMAQNKVDVFNDLRGDIKNFISPNELRSQNTVMYTSPSFSGIVGQFAYSSSEEDDVDNGKSLSISYTNDALYLALAFDQDIRFENAEALRAVAQYSVSGWQFGLLFEQSENEGEDKEDALVASILYNLNSAWAVKAQYGQSDIPFAYDGALRTDKSESFSLGADYRLNKNFLLYGFYTDISAEDAGVAQDVVDNRYLGVGVDFRF
jgi:predicted porin